jgi:hypothetical protein
MQITGVQSEARGHQHVNVLLGLSLQLVSWILTIVRYFVHMRTVAM